MANRLDVQTRLRELKSIGEDWFSYHSGLLPISNLHPPSLKNPIAVKVPTAQDGWKKKDSDRKKRQAREDLVEVHKRMRRQSGKPELAETASYPVYPSFGQWM
jgi:hypothetical protein